MNTPTVDKITFDSSVIHEILEILNGGHGEANDEMLDRLTAIAESQGLACWTDLEGQWKWLTSPEILPA